MLLSRLAMRLETESFPRPISMPIISQRTSAVRFADRILVLEDGICVGQGTHEELLASCPVYREIHQASAGEEEKNRG
jgi:ATP-binding cassette subfamily B protein